MQGGLFEWIIICGKEKYCLTENQYKVFLDQHKNRLVVYETFSINPAFVSSTYQQRAKELKKLYPCDICKARGLMVITKKFKTYDGKEAEIGEDVGCSNCKGTGIDLSVKVKKQNPLSLDDGFS